MKTNNSNNRKGLSCSEAGKLGAKKSLEIIKNKVLKNKEVYYLNPKKCKQCDGVLSYDKKNNKFCSQSCSATYNNIGVQRNFKIDPVTNQKIINCCLKSKK